MVERKTHFITHIILWILILLILFPIVWVISTSVRRDEAAFSTKLFSSRISLQNYKDLIAPEKNVPALIQEVQNLILVTPPYDKWSKERIEKEIERDLISLEKYIKETRDRYNLVSINFVELNKFLDLKVHEIKRDISFLLKNLKEYLERHLSQKGIENKDIYNSKISQLEHITEKLRFINEKIRQNLDKYNKILREYDKVQQRVLAINRVINNDINKEISEINQHFHSHPFVSVAYQKSSDIYSRLSVLEEKLSKYPDFFIVYENLKQITSKVLYLDSRNGVIIQASLIEILDKLELSLKELESNINKLKNYNLKLVSLRQENEFLEMQKELLENEEGKLEEELKPTTKYEQIKLFIGLLEEKIDKLDGVINFEEIVEEMSIWEEEFREFTTLYITDYGRDDLISKIETAADRLKWFNDYNTFYNKAQIFAFQLDRILKNIDALMQRIKNKWRDILERSIKGEKLNLVELDNLYDIIKTDYVNFVSSNMNVVSKKAGDLMDIIPYKETKKWLNNIDKEIFRIDQIWKQKTKHYFLKWVRNSILVAGIAAIITTLICSLAAYPFSRMRFWGRRYGILTLLLIQMFPSAVYMIAIYSLLNILGRFISFLGLDTLSGLTFVYLGNIAYNMYLIKGYYDTIPDSLEESAMIDGATRFQTFYKIVFPLARPILTVVVILTFMNIFNDFIFARIILQDAQKYTYAIGLWTFSSGPYQTEWGLFTAAALLGMLPMTILFLSLQRYIVSGLTKGAVKG